MEYRGYDSAGVALISNGSVYCRKTAGKVSVLEEAIRHHPVGHPGQIGIGHTRWATHGAPTVENAHPHSSADGQIWLVHNGIIENYQELKGKLVADGIKFESDTDTEVVAKLIGHFYHGDLRSAVLAATKQLRGAFALCVMSKSEPGRLIGVKMASPLIAGIGTNEIIIASDASAIVEHTKKVVYLEDGELIDVQDGKYSVLDFRGSKRREPVANIDWNVEAAGKAGYDHYLLKEIMEQPNAVRETLRGHLVPESGDIRFDSFTDIGSRLNHINRVVLLGIGTSYYAAKLGELYFNALSNLPTVAVMSPEFRYTRNPVDERTWLIAVSQSGETADTLAAMEEAKRNGALVTGIVNVVGSSIARATDACVYNHIGPEISVASTKAFTSQSLLLLLHAIHAGFRHGLDAGLSSEIIDTCGRLPQLVSDLLEQRSRIERVAKDLSQAKNMLYIGRQYNYPVALEGALKIKEIAYVHAEGLSGGELKHGFIALIDEATPTIALATTDAVTDKMLANISEVHARGGRVIGIAHEENKQFDDTIIVPDAGSVFLQPLINNIALQLLAYYSAKLRHRDIDQPRNLAKSVTVE
jgi:glucosamine--fructose-6-phosphate aminotransferase (isomerizing)